MTVPINPDPFLFLWQVEGAGYEWVKGNDLEWHLAARASAGPQRRLRPYAPLKDSRLFLRFAAVKPTRADIKAFANRYGVLFGRYADTDAVRRPSGQYSISQLVGTSLHRWRLEIEQMNGLVEVWRAVRAGKKNKLNLLFGRAKEQ